MSGKKITDPIPLEKQYLRAVFCRRLSDGKFYRGARWYRWTKHWQRAAILPVQFWKDWILGKDGRKTDCPMEFVTPEQIVDEAVNKHEHL